jgi:hypothetical protein
MVLCTRQSRTAAGSPTNLSRPGDACRRLTLHLRSRVGRVRSAPGPKLTKPPEGPRSAVRYMADLNMLHWAKTLEPRPCVVLP